MDDMIRACCVHAHHNKIPLDVESVILSEVLVLLEVTVEFRYVQVARSATHDLYTDVMCMHLHVAATHDSLNTWVQCSTRSGSNLYIYIAASTFSWIQVAPQGEESLQTVKMCTTLKSGPLTCCTGGAGNNGSVVWHWIALGIKLVRDVGASDHLKNSMKIHALTQHHCYQFRKSLLVLFLEK